MSQENVETVRRLYSLGADAAGIVRGDYNDVFRDYFTRNSKWCRRSLIPIASLPIAVPTACVVGLA